MADWNWPGQKGKPIQVNVYSSCEETELFLDGKSLGRKVTGDKTRLLAQWLVPYAEGELKTIGYTKGVAVDSSFLKTAGEVSSIALLPDSKELKANAQDLCYVTIQLKDKNGIINPKAENLLHFSVEGPGSIVAVGNANPVSLESYQLPKRKAWQGKCLVIIKSQKEPGTIRLIVASEGLPSSEIEVQSIQ